MQLMGAQREVHECVANDVLCDENCGQSAGSCHGLDDGCDRVSWGGIHGDCARGASRVSRC